MDFVFHISFHFILTAVGDATRRHGSLLEPRKCAHGPRQQSSGRGEGRQKGDKGEPWKYLAEWIGRSWPRDMLTFMSAVGRLARYGFLRAQADRGSSGWLFYLNLSGGQGKGLVLATLRKGRTDGLLSSDFVSFVSRRFS